MSDKEFEKYLEEIDSLLTPGWATWIKSQELAYTMALVDESLGPEDFSLEDYTEKLDPDFD